MDSGYKIAYWIAGGGVRGVAAAIGLMVRDLVNACGWTEEEVAGALGRDQGDP